MSSAGNKTAAGQRKSFASSASCSVGAVAPFLLLALHQRKNANADEKNSRKVLESGICRIRHACSIQLVQAR